DLADLAVVRLDRVAAQVETAERHAAVRPQFERRHEGTSWLVRPSWQRSRANGTIDTNRLSTASLWLERRSRQTGCGWCFSSHSEAVFGDAEQSTSRYSGRAVSLAGDARPVAEHA